jgi:sucrose phosphorylase
MVYNFALPPLLAFTLLTGNLVPFRKWLENWKLPSKEVCFFNFLASHDGVGVRPVSEILTPDEIEVLIASASANEGMVSYKSNPDGTESPYEINCNYLSLLCGETRDLEMGISRFILAHAILLSLPGLPALYIHSLLGSMNATKEVERTGMKRSINREKLRVEDLECQISDDTSHRSRIFRRLLNIIESRGQSQCFNPYGDFHMLDLGQQVIGWKRVYANEVMHCFFNLTPETHYIEIDAGLKSLLTGAEHGLKLELPPYEFEWLTP